ncbi:hypothetical protein [Rhodococcus sp. 06-1460-1B]|uniref:hypothetical protein n=1 Tax=Rhodococcus sp. 06-1460-1B TaxID=2022501 RepID=UPI000B9BA294|nr:hypothetical protein [Rhodococcus sp. 06-1460-1B]OZD63113.1 hypothetical protein CH268_09215 [Rhodococcus sp. 06-1460-1B]
MLPAELADLYVYGDSYGAGAWSTAAAHRYFNRIVARLRSVNSSNRATSGNTLADTVADAANGSGKLWAPGAKGVVVVDGALNEVIKATAATGSAQDVIGAPNNLRSLLRILRAGIWADELDASFTYTGTWPNVALPVARAGSAKRTTVVGSTAEIAGYVPTAIDLVFIGWAPTLAACTFDVKVGGTTYASVVASNTFYSTNVKTAGNNSYGPLVFRVSGLPAGSKTISVAFTGGDMYFDGYLNPTNLAPPSIVLAKALKLSTYQATQTASASLLVTRRSTRSTRCMTRSRPRLRSVGRRRFRWSTTTARST